LNKMHILRNLYETEQLNYTTHTAQKQTLRHTHHACWLMGGVGSL